MLPEETSATNITLGGDKTPCKQAVGRLEAEMLEQDLPTKSVQESAESSTANLEKNTSLTEVHTFTGLLPNQDDKMASTMRVRESKTAKSSMRAGIIPPDTLSRGPDTKGGALYQSGVNKQNFSSKSFHDLKRTKVRYLHSPGNFNK